MSAYHPRVVDEQLRLDLQGLGAVVLEGPRACGKTWTAREQAASAIYLDDPNDAELARLDARAALSGQTPRLIDEWQVVPDIWNAARREVDDRGRPGQFILTGSAVLPPDASRHSGAGRFARVRMRPMSLSESGESTRQVSFAALLRGEAPSGESPHAPLDYADLVVRGGWPALIGAEPRKATRFVDGYLAASVDHDVDFAGSRKRDPVRFRRFLQAYAQVVASTASLNAIRKRVVGEGLPADGLHWVTADAYLAAAERLMVVDEVPAWSPQLRSRTRLVGVPKRNLVDPSLAASLLGADASRLRGDPETLGFLFESLAIRDVQVYAQALGATVHHYRERSGDLEVDLVVEGADGAWMGVEVKLGSHRIDQAAASLRAVADRRVTRPPQALVVLTGGPYAFRREDGVFVVPLGALTT